MTQEPNDDVIGDLQLELAALQEDLRAARDRIARLEAILVATERRDELWLPLRDDEQTEYPESMEQLLDWLSYRLKNIISTADPGPALALDEFDMLGTWAAECWSHLLALDDYVSARLEGAFSGDVFRYLKAPPVGYRSFSLKRFAASESEPVRRSAGLTRARTFTVPEVISESGEIPFFAHTKIAKHGSVSPRMHLFDAYSTDRHVYVGYIGRHLPTSSGF